MSGIPPLLAHEDGGLKDPECAAVYAMAYGGYTTPAIEAFRMIEDALRALHYHDTTDKTQPPISSGLRALAWVNEHREETETVMAQDDYEKRRYRVNWRQEMEALQ